VGFDRPDNESDRMDNRRSNSFLNSPETNDSCTWTSVWQQ